MSELSGGPTRARTPTTGSTALPSSTVRAYVAIVHCFTARGG